MASKSSIHLLIFYMQRKEMYKLTPQLCRIAKQEYLDKIKELPADVDGDERFQKVLQMIEYIENSEFANASEILAEAYKQHEEMMGHFQKKQKGRGSIRKSPSILEDSWEPPVRPDDIPTPPAICHNLNEDDSRNWNSRSPVLERDYNYAVLQGATVQNTKSERLSYTSTLVQRDKPAHVPNSVRVLNSPTVLADRFTELYKKEWKSARGELGHVLGDKHAIRHLLWIIAKSSIICASLATQQLQDAENSVVGIMVSRDPLNKKSLLDESISKANETTVSKARAILIDYRRELANLSVPMLQKEIRRAIASELGTFLPRRFTGIGNHFIQYAELCVQLTWLMYVQDPPMHLEWLTKEQEGSAFKMELYTYYSKPGTVFDYCVWPVVRQYRNGPVLCKGVAQAR